MKKSELSHNYLMECKERSILEKIVTTRIFDIFCNDYNRIMSYDLVLLNGDTVTITNDGLNSYIGLVMYYCKDVGCNPIAYINHLIERD